MTRSTASVTINNGNYEKPNIKETNNNAKKKEIHSIAKCALQLLLLFFRLTSSFVSFIFGYALFFYELKVCGDVEKKINATRRNAC